MYLLIHHQDCRVKNQDIEGKRDNQIGKSESRAFVDLPVLYWWRSLANRIRGAKVEAPKAFLGKEDPYGVAKEEQLQTVMLKQSNGKGAVHTLSLKALGGAKQKTEEGRLK